MLRHPKHFHHWTPRRVYRMQAPVRLFRVRHVEAYSDHRGTRVLHDRVIREVAIPAGRVTGMVELRPARAEARRGRPVHQVPA